MPPIALYYPWMHFQNDNWLKLALLTWDRIVRMRPAIVEDHDQDLVKQLRGETEFIVEDSPSPAMLDTVAESFGQIFDTNPELLLERYGLREPLIMRRDNVGDVRLAGWRGYQPPITQHVAKLGPLGSTLAWVYAGEEGAKIGSGLRKSLIEIGLAEPAEGPWVGLHPQLGSVYLAVLTDVMARSENLSPVTDDVRMHGAVGALDRLASLLLDDHVRLPAVENTDNAYMHLALRTVIEPDNLASVPVSKIIRFRERHRAELVAFHEHVASLGTELQAIADVESLEVATAHLKSLYERRTQPQLNELRRALRAHHIESSAGLLVQKIDFSPAVGTVLGSVAAAGGHIAVASTAIAVTLVPYLATKIKSRRQQIRNSPASYLLAADRELAGRTLLGQLHRRLI